MEEKSVTKILLLQADLLSHFQILENKRWRFYLKVPRWILLFHHCPFNKGNTPAVTREPKADTSMMKPSPEPWARQGWVSSTGRAAGSNKPPLLRDSGTKQSFCKGRIAKISSSTDAAAAQQGRVEVCRKSGFHHNRPGSPQPQWGTLRSQSREPTGSQLWRGVIQTQSFATQSQFLILTSKGQTNPINPSILVLLFCSIIPHSPASFQQWVAPSLLLPFPKILESLRGFSPTSWGNHNIRIQLGPQLLHTDCLELLKPDRNMCCSKGLCCSKRVTQEMPLESEWFGE